MAQAKRGDTIEVHYTGRFEDGTVFDTAVDDEVLEFTIGESRMIPGFEQAVIGMDPGEEKTVRIPADQAYGPYIEEMVMEVDRNRFPEHITPKVGQRLRMRSAQGHPFSATVIDISESRVTIDANHPLAGKDLIFDIQLVEIA